MKVELKIKIGYSEVEVKLDGYVPLVEALREAVKKTAKDYSDMVEIK